MTVFEYTPERAKILKKLNIPELELQAKILWFDILTSKDISEGHASKELHSHSFFETLFSLSGTMDYEYDGKTMQINTGNALFLPPNAPHKFLNCSGDVVKLSVAFSLGDSLDIKNASEIIVSQDVLENINYILKLSENKDFLTAGIISGRILEILQAVFSALGIVLPQTQDMLADSRVLVAKEFIHRKKDSIINCEDVAKECCLSSKQLNRIFKSYTGASVSEYITSSKIKYAKQLLLNDNKSIKEIGFMLGFENESSFVSFFKRHTSLTPGVFRKELLEMSLN